MASPIQWAQFGLSAASSIGSGIGSILQAAETNRHNQWLRQFSEQQAQTQVEQAAINRQFQERMSRNAVQYRAQDMQRAGINPLLAGNNGAQAMTGSTAFPVSAPSASFPAVQFTNHAAEALESFPYGRNQNAQADNYEQSTKNLEQVFKGLKSDNSEEALKLRRRWEEILESRDALEVEEMAFAFDRTVHDWLASTGNYNYSPSHYSATMEGILTNPFTREKYVKYLERESDIANKRYNVTKDPEYQEALAVINAVGDLFRSLGIFK